MFKKLIISTLSLITILPAYADNDTSCWVQVAVATPPVHVDQNVAFNINSEYGFSKAVTLTSHSGPQIVDKIPCSSAAISISATMYNVTANNKTEHEPVSIGQCALRAGTVTLNGPQNSVSVVFPYDFNCNNN